MTGTYGITITGNVAVITLTVPALWWLAVTVMAGVFLTWTTVRDWLAGVLARVWQEDKQPARVGTGWGFPTNGALTDIIQPATAQTNSGGTRTWE